ncbi:MAG: sialidase family protein [Acidimicrobiales bacterium]
MASGLVLAVAATVIGYAGSQDRQPRVVGGNPPINRGALDVDNLATYNSPTIVRNPVRSANLAVANRIDTPGFSCALHTSFDSGATWEPSTIPFPEGEEAPPRCFAPDLAFASDGTLYLVFVTLKGPGNAPNAVWFTRSTDGGRTLALPRRLQGPAPPLAFQVRLVADPARANRLYLSWLQAFDTVSFGFAAPGNPILTSRSDDAGATWSPAVRVNPAARGMAVAPSPAVGPAGELYVLYLDLGNDRLDYLAAHEGNGGPPDGGPWALVLARSTDNGATWRESTVDAEVVPIERFVVFIPPFPSLAVDAGDGRIYVGFHDGRGGDADVLVWTSGDGGATFSRPRRVNDTRPRDGTWQYLPKLAVAPNGRLDVVYYDRRADRQNLFNEVSLQASTDGGRSFGPRLRLSNRSFDSRSGFGYRRNLPDLGTRLGLLSTSGAALAVWPDTRAATEETIKQDLGTALVEFPAPSRVRGLLRVGGPALGLVALALLAWSVRLDRSGTSWPDQRAGRRPVDFSPR